MATRRDFGFGPCDLVERPTEMDGRGSAQNPVSLEFRIVERF